MDYVTQVVTKFAFPNINHSAKSRKSGISCNYFINVCSTFQNFDCSVSFKVEHLFHKLQLIDLITCNLLFHIYSAVIFKSLTLMGRMNDGAFCTYLYGTQTGFLLALFLPFFPHSYQKYLV